MQKEIKAIAEKPREKFYTAPREEAVRRPLPESAREHMRHKPYQGGKEENAGHMHNRSDSDIQEKRHPAPEKKI